MLFKNPTQQKPCIAICTPIPMKEGPNGPVLDTISTKWHRARCGLASPTNFNTIEMFVDGLEVGMARSQIAARCLAMTPQPEFLFFIDYDVLLSQDALTKLIFRARTLPDYDIYAGVYCCKGHTPPDPLIYGDHGQGSIWDWAVGDILTTQTHGVKSVHMGLTMIRVSAFQKIKDAGLVSGDGNDHTDRPFFLTTDETKVERDTGYLTQAGTEDIYFCDLLIRAGGKILVDTSVLAGHEDKATGVVYGLPYDKHGPVGRAKWLRGADGELQDEKECKEQNLKLAIDLGSGDTRIQREGYKTYTVDARPCKEVDYVQDLRKLNLPDNHYDLVGSMHSFEHIGRWDQEMVWSEAFRICKPGGICEIIVPNIEWAAAKIMAGETDVHVMNVLYGSQEAGGMEREYNTHYFGYTPDLARALAETAGFVDVRIQSYKDREEMGYEILISGRKPCLDEVDNPSSRIWPEKCPDHGEIKNDNCSVCVNSAQETKELESCPTRNGKSTTPTEQPILVTDTKPSEPPSPESLPSSRSTRSANYISLADSTGIGMTPMPANGSEETSTDV